MTKEYVKLEEKMTERNHFKRLKDSAFEYYNHYLRNNIQNELSLCDRKSFFENMKNKWYFQTEKDRFLVAKVLISKKDVGFFCFYFLRI